jgi:hypothetical protein
MPGNPKWVKGGPSPNPKGRGNSPSRFSQKLVDDFARHWRTHGYKAIQRVYEEHPAIYLKTAAQLVPRELLLQITRPMEQMSDIELQAQVIEEQEAGRKLIEHIKLKGGAELIEQAQRELTGEEPDEDGEDEA